MLRSSDCLGAKLAHFMTSSNITVKHFVQEFLYQACDEDGLLLISHQSYFCRLFTCFYLFYSAKLLCSLVGVGNAAGLLQEKNLLGNFVQFFQRSVSA